MSRGLQAADVAMALRGVGLSSGARVMVHSSLSSMGYVLGGAESVVAAFVDVLGPEGTLMVPTFTHSGTEYFDPLESPSKNGMITEAVRHHPKAVRSLHPTHAVTVIGPDAEELVADDLERGALAEDCAVDRLAQKEGWVFLLGVDFQSNSTIHVGEAYAGDPDRHKQWNPERPKHVVINHPQQGEIEVLLTSMMGSTVAFQQLEPLMRKRGQIIDGRIGEARCQLMEGRDVIDGTVDILRPLLNG